MIASLKKYFPEWKEIFAFACMALVFVSPMMMSTFITGHNLSLKGSGVLIIHPMFLETCEENCIERKATVNLMKPFMKDER